MQGAAAKPAAERAVDCRIAEREQHAAFARGCRLQRGKFCRHLPDQFESRNGFRTWINAPAGIAIGGKALFDIGDAIPLAIDDRLRIEFRVGVSPFIQSVDEVFRVAQYCSCKDPGIVGHGQAVGDPFEDVQPGDLPTAVDDLIQPSLADTGGGGEPGLAHPRVLLHQVQQGPGVALAERLPGESILYLGDTARVPYGNKSAATVRRYAEIAARFLIERHVKALLIACNTASAYAIDALTSSSSVPVLGAVGASFSLAGGAAALRSVSAT